MKVGELIELVDRTITHLRIAVLANQSRSFESPYTSYEFIQRSLELQKDLEDLTRARERLSELDPESEAEEHFSKEELEEFLRLLELLGKANAHSY
ncbi:hypothetical protein A3L12_00435 [Thermococcus sp. P6]|uniref:hypothetical protein n=1 Tax=Thermococcus sp. P6 TaxID=122420 RepID=UPI000B59A8FF|nr:hypothetical protein [Thermococcus sp. P6]ASJ11282.1 hypothetical protein A3L12_00435 [Thermococcus sp. P6]